MHDPQLALAVAAAHAAGQVLLRFFEGKFEVATKSSPLDLVTSADRAAERVILEALGRAYPDHSFLAEESGLIGQDTGGPLPAVGGCRWIIDPLDGTTNFAHGFPHFSVSIGLCDHRGPRLGVIHDPTRDETFCAVRGKGAWLHKPGRSPRRLAVSRKNILQHALVATGFSYQRALAEQQNNLPEFCRVVPQIRCVRRAGSAALDLAYVAAGRLDGYWEYHLQPWDVAAGCLLVQEAGGQVRRLDGAEWNLGNPDLLATGDDLLPLLLGELRAAHPQAA